jgi:hypothetical protein
MFDVWAAGKYLWLFQIKRGNRPTNGFIQRWLLSAHRAVMVPHSYIFLAWYNPRQGWHFFRLTKVHRVYRIVNRVDGKMYVGVSSRYNIWDRWQAHCTNLVGSLIGAAIAKDGVHNFNFEVLEVCETLAELSEAEKKWIRHYNCMKPYGYNRTPGGLDGIMHISQESRARMGAKRRGERHPMAKLSNAQVAEIQASKLDAWDVAAKYKISYGHARALVMGWRRNGLANQ